MITGTSERLRLVATARVTSVEESTLVLANAPERQQPCESNGVEWWWAANCTFVLPELSLFPAACDFGMCMN
jgi:hypothetical protein